MIDKITPADMVYREGKSFDLEVLLNKINEIVDVVNDLKRTYG